MEDPADGAGAVDAGLVGVEVERGVPAAVAVAENAARAVLAGRAGATPRRAEGTSEMIRQIKIARDVEVKARATAIITLKTLIVTAPDGLRGELEGLTKTALRERCAGLRPGSVTDELAACKHALRSIARHWQHLDADIKTHDKLLDGLTAQAAPALREAFGVGPDVAAEMLILAGDRPSERLRSEAAFAMLCGACPIPASSGMTQRHRVNYGGHRQANSALYRTVIVRMRFHPATITYVAKRTAEGKTKREIIRCLKRYVAREIYHLLTAQPTPIPTPIMSS